jgi:hypothetical protein
MDVALEDSKYHVKALDIPVDGPSDNLNKCSNEAPRRPEKCILIHKNKTLM